MNKIKITKKAQTGSYPTTVLKNIFFIFINCEV